MGLRGKKRRAKNFAADIERGQGYRAANRDGRVILVGQGQHRRLVSKVKSTGKHLGRALIQQQRLSAFLDASGIKPKYFSLAAVPSHPQTGVQVYFHRPSLRSLMDYLTVKNGGAPAFPLKNEDTALCKRFSSEFKSIGLKKLQDAEKEILSCLATVGEPFQIASNIIVVGQTSGGKVKLAIVDV